jgi:hypothetical protein
MSDDPRWHGWATPEQVGEMIIEMLEFIYNNPTRDLKFFSLYDDIKRFLEKIDTYDFCERQNKAHKDFCNADL